MKLPIDKSRIYTYIAATAAFLQMSVPQWHLPEIQGRIVTSALLAIISVFTILKQRSSVEVNNKATIVTYILISIALAGFVNDVLGFIHFNDNLQNILRNIIASLIGLLNLASKTLFPTEAGISIQQTKAVIKIDSQALDNLPSIKKN